MRTNRGSARAEAPPTRRQPHLIPGVEVCEVIRLAHAPAVVGSSHVDGRGLVVELPPHVGSLRIEANHAGVP